MQRRDFLFGVGALSMSALAAARATGKSWVKPPSVRPGYRATYFVPGYHPSIAYYRGKSVLEVPMLRRNIPKGYEGNLVLLNRISERGEPTVRTLMPVKGHDVDIHPGGHVGVLNTQNGNTMATFDPATLDLDVFHEFEAGIYGGGHSVFLPGGDVMAVTERKAFRKFTGDPKAHEGRLAIRDNKTLKALETYSCHGIAPHEVQLMRDGKHLAVSNYGSVYDPKFEKNRPLLLDPSVTIIELASGKLVETIRPAKPAGEIRHLAAYDRTRIFCLQNIFAPPAEQMRLLASVDDFHLPDLVVKYGMKQTALPMLKAEARAGGYFTDLTTPNMLSMLRAQSITYDPRHDEAIGTFPGANRVLVFRGADGMLVREIDTEATGGLRLPRGICLHPDGEHYAVSGDFHDIALYRRGSHERVHDRSIFSVIFGHSHITAV